jgi:hypothetical protein
MLLLKLLYIIFRIIFRCFFLFSDQGAIDSFCKWHAIFLLLHLSSVGILNSAIYQCMTLTLIVHETKKFNCQCQCHTLAYDRIQISKLSPNMMLKI